MASLAKLKPITSAQKPGNWPSRVSYTPRPVTTGTIRGADIIEATSKVDSVSRPGPLIPAPTGPSPNVKIQPITIPSHPACNQHGLFATKALLPDTFILLYCGNMHGPDDPPAGEQGNYDLSLDRELDIGIDASQLGNEARFINDYRGVRDTGPNADFRDVWIDLGSGKALKAVGVFVLSAGQKGKTKDVAKARGKGIKKGDEILVSYGKGFWSHRMDE